MALYHGSGYGHRDFFISPASVFTHTLVNRADFIGLHCLSTYNLGNGKSLDFSSCLGSGPHGGRPRALGAPCAGHGLAD